MNIGIMVHSQSGHTLALSKAIAARLDGLGHHTDVRPIRAVGPVSPRSHKFQLKNPPAVDEFDAILVGGPVWGFRVCPVTMAYLEQLGKLKGKKALSFVTHLLPFPWMGANQAIALMNVELETSGADVLPGVAVQYFFGLNKTKLELALNSIATSFGT